MTNREMAKGVRPSDDPKPNATKLPPMPGPEDSPVPAVEREPIDSPQPNESGRRAPPDSRRPGLATRRE